ncbi:hypothetical protein QQ045_023485 [Rhodiola kirilowii]
MDMMEEDVMMESILHLKSDIIAKACSMAMTMATKSKKPYLVDNNSARVVTISFPGVWTVADWYSKGPFGDTKINRDLFPSLKSIGLDEIANVNQAFQRRFEAVLRNSDLQKEVEKADSKKKQILFTGHSSGAAVAIFATLWLLEKHLKSNDTDLPKPICLAFGAPLVGDKIFHHALERQKWSSCFVNFVMKCDIVPRILLAPLTSIERQFQPVLNYLNPSSGVSGSDSFPSESLDFYMNLMIKASSTVSHAASKLIECTNELLKTLTSFDVLSPYRPFGTYVFFARNETTCVLRNPDAVLQLLFYSCQVENEANIYYSLKEHVAYANELGNRLPRNIINLEDCLETLPLSSQNHVQIISKALDDLGVSTRGRLCVRAAGELKKQKERNEANINMKRGQIIAGLEKLEEYKAGCELRRVCYYDAFKLSREEKDFLANVHRLELAGMWDEIKDLLKNYQLPDDFEGKEQWIALGTKFRRVMEPLDIANYYRHDKNGDTGPYLDKGRPKRYIFTQRWQEHFDRDEPSAESCPWAEVEELRLKNSAVPNEYIKRLAENIE